jgi:AcrR family transcriptional regulator
MKSNTLKVGRPAQLTKAAIIKTARNMYYDDLTMSNVAKKMKVPVTSLYRHFPKKEVLLAALAAEVAANFTLPQPDPANWRNWLIEAGRRYRKLLKDNPVLADRHQEARLLEQSIGAIYEPVLETLEKAGFETSMVIKLWAGVVACAVWTSIHERGPRDKNAKRASHLTALVAHLGPDLARDSPRLLSAIPYILNPDIDAFFENILSWLVAGMPEPITREPHGDHRG